MDLRLKFAARLLAPLLVLTLQSGCVTYKLWTNGNLEAYREPAQNSNVRLFEDPQRNDFLVIYNEFSERNNAIRTRAYWLNESQRRLKRQRAPIFARASSSRNLTPVPVFCQAPPIANPDWKFYAVCETNQDMFALYSAGRKIGSYDLPVYNDGRGKYEKMALTPLFVTADLTIIGGCAAVLAGYVFAQSGYSFTATVK